MPIHLKKQIHFSNARCLVSLHRLFSRVTYPYEWLRYVQIFAVGEPVRE